MALYNAQYYAHLCKSDINGCHTASMIWKPKATPKKDFK